MRPLLAAVLAMLAACAAAPPPGQIDLAVPFANPDGTRTTLAGRLCRPAGDAPARLVVIAHGSPARAADRPAMRLIRCDSEAPRWFLQRGFAVVEVLRRGYGATGGSYAEAVSPCTAENYVRSAHETARDLEAAIDAATQLPAIRRDGVVVVGQSAGGWGTLGLASEPDPRISAYVSMAGGRGGHVGNVPNRNCHPENLIAAAGILGRTAPAPMLWIYTENDSFFAPAISQPMQAAFNAAGGHADYHLLPPFAADGHTLFFGRGGSAIWGPLLERYLHDRGAL